MNETDLNDFVLSNMPYFIAVNYQQLLKAETPQKQVKFALHTYNLGLRVLTIGLVSQYLIRDREKVSDPYLNELLLQKFPHLTLDAWQQILFASLQAYEGHRDLFFIPELYDFYWTISEPYHKHKGEVEQIFERLTQISQEIREEQLLPQNERAWEILADETKNLLQEMLQQLAFLQKYDLIRILDFDDLFYDFELHKGIEISIGRKKQPAHINFNRGLFYLRKNAEKFMLLHPFLVFLETEEENTDSILKDTGIYDRFIYERLRYLLTTLGKTIEDDKSVRAFISLLYDTIEEAKRHRQEVEKLTWWQLRDLCADITKRRTATVRHKYHQELYLQRNETYESFLRFLQSHKRCFVLIGKSGVGKSNFLLALDEQLRNSRGDVCLLMYDGANLKVEPSLSLSISQDFDDRLLLAGQQIDNIWREVVKVNDIQDKSFILLVDAINENPNAKELLRQLDELVQKPWPWLKVVFSSRPETWQTIKRGIRLAEASYYREEGVDKLGVELEPFSYSEKMESFSRQELPNAYKKYQQAFNLKTTYDGLSSGIREMLTDPLSLWLIAQTYRGQSVPTNLKTTELIAQYVNALLQSERLYLEDLQLLEKELVPLMVRENHFSNALTISDIDASGDRLYEKIYSEQVLSNGQRVNQSFVNLLDTSILVRQGEGRDQKIAFKYERFYEYFVGIRIFELSKAQTNRTQFFQNIINETEKVPFLWGAIKNAFVQETQQRGFETILNLCFTDQQQIKEMMISALTDLGQDDYLGVTNFLEPFFQTRRKRGFREVKNDEAVINAKRIALEVASRLGLTQILVIAANESSTTIRSTAIQKIYYLWIRDQEKGIAILQNLSKQVRNSWKLPNSRVLETYFGATFLILFENHKDRKTLEALGLTAKEVIRQLLYVGGGMKVNKLLRRLLRQWVVKLIIEYVVRFTKVTRYNVVNPKELGAFFELNKKEQQRLTKFMPYLTRQRTDLENIEAELLAAAQTGDALTSYAMYHLLISQGTLNWEKVKPLIKDIFEIGMKNVTQGTIPHLLTAQMINVPAGICLLQGTDNEDVIGLFRELTQRFLDAGNGQFHCKYGVYFGAYFSTSTFLLEKNEEIDNSFLTQYCLKAVKEQDETLLFDLIWELSNLALGYNRPNLALMAARHLLSLESVDINLAFLNFLAQVRFHYPDYVDDFFIENEVSQNTIEKIKSIEVVEDFDSIAVVPVTRFFAGLPLSDFLSMHEREVFEHALRCRNINQWIEFIVKKIIDGVYDEPILDPQG